MHLVAGAATFIEQEALALLTRLEQLRPFSQNMSMVPAAALSPAAMAAIEHHMRGVRATLRTLVLRLLAWLRGAGREAAPARAYRRFALVRLRFNAVIAQFDIFADVLVQRSEHGTGVWIAGLDDLAADALSLPRYFRAPPVVCYVDRGVGAAIRRARTRLPGGEANPVAIVRVPRERLVGSSLASSIIHEVGHEAATRLGLVESLQPELRLLAASDPHRRLAWALHERWLSETLCDLWSVAKVGLTATIGLIGVVTLPRAFVFRVDPDDPHPFPWIRVKISCAFGASLYPHPQWRALAARWDSFYPPAGLSPQTRALLAMLESTLPRLASVVLGHRPRALRGRSLSSILYGPDREPDRLLALHDAWQRAPQLAHAARPCLAFAVLGQARAAGRIGAAEESATLGRMLTYWAVRSALAGVGQTPVIPARAAS